MTKSGAKISWQKSSLTCYQPNVEHRVRMWTVHLQQIAKIILTVIIRQLEKYQSMQNHLIVTTYQAIMAHAHTQDIV